MPDNYSSILITLDSAKYMDDLQQYRLKVEFGIKIRHLKNSRVMLLANV